MKKFKIHENNSSSFLRSKWERLSSILICATIFGFGWHVRGSGTSDPTVPMLLLLLYVSWIYGPHENFNYAIFGVTVVIFRLLRRGWGTFVGMAGWPGKYPGRLISWVEDYDVVVPWWQGYFWLVLVGLAWSGPAATIIGGYFFTQRKYEKKDWAALIVMYGVGYVLGRLIAP